MLAADPSQPWRNDHPWNPSGEAGSLERRGRRVLWWGVAVAAVLLPWNALAAARPDLASTAVVAVADLAPAALLLRGAWLRRGWRRGGAARLRFDRFPFFLGEPFEGVLELGPRAGQEGTVEVTLACLEMRLQDVAGAVTRREVEVYRATQVILVAPETALTFELPAPERGLGTELRTAEARRWELRTFGRAGAKVLAAFPVPIYAPPVDEGDSPG